MFKDLVAKNRSYRRFDESLAISRETLLELVDLARQTASAANKQPLRYILSSDPSRNAVIFGNIAWRATCRTGRVRRRGSAPRDTSSCWETRGNGPGSGYDHGIAPRPSSWGRWKEAWGAA